MPNWPWNETRLDRRTRIARLYRDTLFEHAPHACYELDLILDDYGQHWITGNRPPHNSDEPMSVTQIAEWLDISVQAVTNRIAAHNIQPVARRNDTARRGGKLFLLTQFYGEPNNTVVISNAGSSCPETA